MRILFSLLLLMVTPVLNAEQQRYDFSATRAFLEDTLEKSGLDGIGMMVWKDGDVVYEEYFGSYDENTRLAIASATKWLSGATVMALVDDGLIALDDPLSKYLAAFKGDKAGITIAQAFSHTSGLGRLRGDGGWRRSTPTLEYANLVAAEPLEVEPGSELRYASESMQVVAAVAEQVTGKRWETLFRERIAGPLGMHNTGYSRDGNAINPMLAGGAGSTVSDYSKFLQMLINQGRYGDAQVLSPQAIRAMHANQSGDVPVTRGSGDRRNRQSQYGVGNWIDEMDAKGDSNRNSSPGAFGTRPWIDWDRNLFGIFFIDRRTAEKEYDADVYELIDLVHAATD